jgi:hypothetical protein
MIALPRLWSEQRDVIEICEFVAAIAALSAAGFWFAAARAPVPSYGPQPMGSNDPATNAHYAEIKRKIRLGAIFNRIAAALTGLSALAQFSAWLFRQ